MGSSGLDFYQSFDWMAVPFQDVQVGDLIANEGSVTKSRQAQKNDWGWRTEADYHKGKWFIKCGKSSSRMADPNNPIVIGRRRERARG